MKIVITGTSSGIGAALACRFSQSGHEVWGLARRSQERLAALCAQHPHVLHWSRCDVSDWNSVHASAQEVARTWPVIDALICCAAMQGPVGPAMSLDAAQWMENIATNLHGTFFCIRAYFDLLRHNTRRAKVVCFSGGGSTSPRPNFTPYAVSKAGVVRMVENLAHEWKETPIDINAIAPGAVDTAMTDQVIALGPERAGAKEYNAAVEQKKRGGTPAEKYIGLTEFLVSPQSDGISGRLLSAVWDSWPQLPGHVSELQSTDLYTLRRVTPRSPDKPWQ